MFMLFKTPVFYSIFTRNGSRDTKGIIESANSEKVLDYGIDYNVIKTELENFETR
jgi:hypothetical protein